MYSIATDFIDMPKLKTHKATAKRIKKTKSGKLIKRTAGQDHFNARETGKKMRKKRRDTSVSPAKRRVIEKSMPYA